MATLGDVSSCEHGTFWTLGEGQVSRHLAEWQDVRQPLGPLKPFGAEGGRPGTRTGPCVGSRLSPPRRWGRIARRSSSGEGRGKQAGHALCRVQAGSAPRTIARAAARRSISVPFAAHRHALQRNRLWQVQ